VSLNSNPLAVRNSLDNVASRDFVIEFLNICLLCKCIFLGWLRILFFFLPRNLDFLILPEEFCTGSSLMPHKKNPDFLELVRGNTGKIYGNLMSVLVTMKGLPLTYNRDMQLDKEPLFSSVETIKSELKIAVNLVSKMELNRRRLEEALKDEELYATELVEFLVYQGVIFSRAHETIGKLICYSEDEGIKIKDMSDKVLGKFNRKLTHKDVRAIMNPKYAVSSKKSLSPPRKTTSVKSSRFK